MAVTNDLLSTTLYTIRDKAVDELYKRNAFLNHAKKSGRGVQYLDGGTQIRDALSFRNHSTVSTFDTGYEALNLAVQDTMEAAIYNWAHFAAPVVITEKELTENKGEKAIISILEERTDNVMGMLQRKFNKQILAGNDADLSGDLNTLNGVSIATGFLEEDVKASQSNTVGGLSKATYNVRGWTNQRATASASFSANGLDAMYDIATEIQAVSNYGIDCVIASVAGFSNYRKAISDQERFISVDNLDYGRMALSWNGKPVEMDADMPTNSGVGTDEITMYFLSFEGIKVAFLKDREFAPSPMIDIPGSIAKHSRIGVSCQLTARHLGSQGILFNGDQY